MPILPISPIAGAPRVSMIVVPSADLAILRAALPDVESAPYFSTSSYATIGDPVPGRGWRGLSIEGASGVIRLGWASAYLIGIIGQPPADETA